MDSLAEITRLKDLIKNLSLLVKTGKMYNSKGELISLPPSSPQRKNAPHILKQAKEELRSLTSGMKGGKMLTSLKHRAVYTKNQIAKLEKELIRLMAEGNPNDPRVRSKIALLEDNIKTLRGGASHMKGGADENYDYCNSIIDNLKAGQNAGKYCKPGFQERKDDRGNLYCVSGTKAEPPNIDYCKSTRWEWNEYDARKLISGTGEFRYVWGAVDLGVFSGLACMVAGFANDTKNYILPIFGKATGTDVKEAQATAEKVRQAAVKIKPYLRKLDDYIWPPQLTPMNTYAEQLKYYGKLLAQYIDVVENNRAKNSKGQYVHIPSTSPTYKNSVQLTLDCVVLMDFIQDEQMKQLTCLAEQEKKKKGSGKYMMGGGNDDYESDNMSVSSCGCGCSGGGMKKKRGGRKVYPKPIYEEPVMRPPKMTAGRLMRPTPMPVHLMPMSRKVGGVLGAESIKGGLSDGRTHRAQIVKKIMNERGVSLIEASKIVKNEGLY